jgi:predicted transglutaminase-like cysteine proteinase
LAVDDIKHYGRAEYWTIPTDGRGDCDDYAVTKRAQLIAAGIPASALRLAVAVTPRSVRHAVLTVATDRGDYILDSLYDEIVPWHAPGYTWLMRQMPDNARSWESLKDPPAAVMLATAATEQRAH